MKTNLEQNINSQAIELEHFREYALLAIQSGQSADTILNGSHAKEVLKLHPTLKARMEDEVMIMEANLLAF